MKVRDATGVVCETSTLGVPHSYHQGLMEDILKEHPDAVMVGVSIEAIIMTPVSPSPQTKEKSCSTQT
jgi:hypothetical protein